MQQEDRIRHLSVRATPRLAQRAVVQPQPGQTLPGSKMEVVGDIVALQGGRLLRPYLPRPEVADGHRNNQDEQVSQNHL